MADRPAEGAPGPLPLGDGVPEHVEDPGSSVVDGIVEREGQHGPGRTQHRRRISYFMLFRLAVLFVFTLLAGYTSYLDIDSIERDAFYDRFIWGSLGLGYFITILFAWWLPRSKSLRAVAAMQTSIDIVLAAVVVQLSGGADSGFVFLYLLAVLGAAIMGDRSQVLAATGACVMIYATTTALHAADIAHPMTATGLVTTFDAADMALAVARTLAAIVGVGTLSVFLNGQLVVSARQVEGLRALNENIVRSLTSGLVTVDVHGDVLFANPTALELLALRDVSDANIDELLPGASKHLEDSGGPLNRFELEVRRAGDNKTLHLGLNCSPLLDAEGRFLGHIVNFQDVTELHDLNRKVARNERLAAIGELAASVAHEVRNPLAAISGSAELLKAGKISDEDRRLADLIHREATRLNATVTDLLSYTRPRAPELLDFDLSRAVGEVVEAIRHDPANALVKFDVHARGRVGVRADPSQVSQVIWNLIRNAIEAQKATGTLRVEVWSTDREACVSIADEGPGIAKAQVERIFEPFYSTKEKGSGFGLAIVHRIVEEHKGSIDVESTEGKGTTFTVCLPIEGPERD